MEKELSGMSSTFCRDAEAFTDEFDIIASLTNKRETIAEKRLQELQDQELDLKQGNVLAWV